MKNETAEDRMLWMVNDMQARLTQAMSEEEEDERKVALRSHTRDFTLQKYEEEFGALTLDHITGKWHQ